MSQQGGRPTGPEDDWWGQLYDDSTGDTGPTAAPDSLDDRFASAAGTVAHRPDQDTPVNGTEPPPRAADRGPSAATGPCAERKPPPAEGGPPWWTAAEPPPGVPGPRPPGPPHTGAPPRPGEALLPADRPAPDPPPLPLPPQATPDLPPLPP
ncbi:hypothetical protein RM812_36635, partial [Streptomyces sp. DSM 40712]|nr:hypothetical protein [Streptomyces sp. DSM 40712]